MSDMVERLMRAAAAYADSLPKTSDNAAFIYSHRKGLALAMIAAMRDPTEAMIEAGRYENARDVWHWMIDAALAD
jgi:hypothetical protein